MKLHIETDPKTQMVKVFLWHTDQTGRHYYTMKDGAVLMVDVDATIVYAPDAEPFLLQLPLVLWEAIKGSISEDATRQLAAKFQTLADKKGEMQVLSSSTEDNKYLQLLIDTQISTIDKLIKIIHTWQRPLEMKRPKRPRSKRVMKQSVS